VSAPAIETRESEVRITRVFDVPRERVFAAWTEAARLAQWFAPRGFSVTACEAGPHAGSAFSICLRSAEGRDYWVRGTYREVERPARLVIACTAEDEHGKPSLEEVIEVTLTALRGKTTLRLRASTRPVAADAASLLGGLPEMWARTIARLGTHLEPE
jgi:uncharacterized protein YndB with AHSA1/START domain